MVDSTQNIIDVSRKQVSSSYRIALLLVAATIIAIASISGHMIEKRVDDTPIVILTGKQRFWTERIGFLTYQLSTDTENNRSDVLKMLKAAIDQMESEHDKAMHADEKEAMPLALQKIYFTEPTKLESQVQIFFSHAHNILNLSPQQINLTQADITAVLEQANQLIYPMGAVLEYYAKESITNFNWLHDVILGLSGLALFILAIVTFVLLRPAIAYIAQAQQKLMELNRLKGDFLANMSHEIRTPMNGIFGMAELLLDSELNERQQHYARTLQNSADHLLGLINDILDFSKLEAGHMTLDPIHFNLLATIEDVLEILSSRAREKNLELLLRYAPGIPHFVVADPGRIRQILFNLVGNAIKFTDQGYVIVHVDIGASNDAKKSRLIISVEDTGIGIPENKISALFEKFMQVETGSTRARQGTGLGLAISRNLIELMGGHIQVKSTPGKGTIFTWDILLEEIAVQAVEIEHSTVLVHKRILLVDDLAPNRLLFSEILTAAGVECLVAENAKEALSILAYEHDNKRTIHVVMTDYMMPHIDGIQLIQTLKADQRFQQIPVMILTSSTEHGVIKTFDEIGAAACLTKPISRQQLLDTLLHVINATVKGEKSGIITAKSSVAMTARKFLAHEKPLEGMHLLLVEDNRVNLEITTEILAQFGCQISTAENGRQAVEAARANTFDLIFMDCQMPEMDGFEAARHIVTLKASGDISAVPIIALTANALKGDRERCLESGMDDYLSKPVRRANLEAILLKWLREKLERRLINRAATTQSATPIITKQSQTKTMISKLDGFDVSAFAVAKDTLGNKLGTVIGYYLKDAENYINTIAEATRLNKPDIAILPAHTLKSSSRQFGAMHLADLAEQMEMAARDKAGSGNVDRLASILPHMREAFMQVRPILETSLQD